ncbi:MAG: CBS domain-containing protein [Candidatus Latescibacteria bacterium]|nr:CBS domain-containing protein [bacterium]MBD3423255.1 CBS domain-containing protein [Candidatus Latescibacterota bacterium]
MQISEYINRNFHRVYEDTPMKDIARLFFETEDSVIPVLDREDNLRGIIRIDDFMHIFLPDYIDLIKNFDFVRSFGALEKYSFTIEELLFVAEDLMIVNPPSLEEEDSLLKGLAILYKNGLYRIPVVSGKKLIGMISLNDICRGIYENKG